MTVSPFGALERRGWVEAKAVGTVHAIGNCIDERAAGIIVNVDRVSN
jgi:hypothetical protein